MREMIVESLAYQICSLDPQARYTSLHVAISGCFAHTITNAVAITVVFLLVCGSLKPNVKIDSLRKP